MQQTPPLLEAMRQSALDKDWHLLAAAVHKIIPSFAIMEMNQEVESMAKQIQEAAKKKQFNDETAQIAIQLETICRKACKELD